MKNNPSVLATAGISALALVTLLVFGACRNPLGDRGADSGSGKAGSLTISIGDGVSRTLLPDLSMDPASYQVDGSGPGGASFSETVTGSSSVTVEGLAFGEWEVTVTAFNDEATAIGAATGTVTVHSNASATLELTVVPYDGFGTLSLDLAWSPGDIDIAQVESTLMPANGATRTLDFTVNGGAGSASFSADDVATGYHTLSLKLLDNGALAMGAVEVVRIVKDATTSGSFTFANLNKPGGGIDVNITPSLGDPLTVSIAGASATKASGDTMNLTASNAEAVNATYVWYVNGESAATGSSFAFDDSWTAGYYRIDVTAFSADGSRAGSAGVDVEVTEGTALRGTGSPAWAQELGSG